jgi:hypothetical protein
LNKSYITVVIFYSHAICNFIFLLVNEAEKIDELKKLERCSLPPVKPNSFICSLTITPSWTYEAKAGECLSYQYGGCGKTTNLFGSQDECKAACSRGPGKITSRHNGYLLEFCLCHFIYASSSFSKIFIESRMKQLRKNRFKNYVGIATFPTTLAKRLPRSTRTMRAKQIVFARRVTTSNKNRYSRLDCATD